MQFIRSRSGIPTSGRRAPQIHAISHANGTQVGRVAGQADKYRAGILTNPLRRFLGMTLLRPPKSQDALPRWHARRAQ